MSDTDQNIDWQKLCGLVPDEVAASMEAVLLGLGVSGVQTINADFLPPDDGDPPPPGKSRLEFYLPIETETSASLVVKVMNAWRRVLAAHGIQPESAPLSRERLVNNDWATRWREFFHPQKISTRIWIAPSWEPVTVSDDELVIEIDPGMAFGTGTHETTSLVIAALDEMALAGELPQRMLDVGTGSGILTIAAYKLGLHQIDAIDNDPMAVEVAQQNLARNGLPATACAPTTMPINEFSTPYPLVIANIISSVLLMLKPHLVRLTQPGGVLLLSGVLETEADSVAAAFAETGLVPSGREQKGEWVRLHFTKAAS